MRATVVIPFRLASGRFPRKALASFRGRTLLEHAIANARALDLGPVALTGPVDDLREAAAAIDLSGALRVPSSADHGCATDRLVEIFRELGGDVFVSLPVDEPALDPYEIRAALAVADPFGDADAVTFYCDFFAEEDWRSPLSAKLVTDARGRLLHMSRAIIPVKKDGSVQRDALKKNVGVFVFRRPFLEALAEHRATPTFLDKHEGLEQLRWLELGLAVRCHKVRHAGFGVDVPSQLALLEARMGAPCR